MTSPVATFRAANKEMYHGACSRGFDAPGALVASAKWVAFDPTPESGIFLIYTEHHCPLRGRHVQSDNISYFFNEQRIRGQLERFYTVRLESESTPDSAHCGRADSRGLRHLSSAPMGCVLR